MAPLDFPQAGMRRAPASGRRREGGGLGQACPDEGLVDEVERLVSGGGLAFRWVVTTTPTTRT
jgi:hypothetical protein